MSRPITRPAVLPLVLSLFGICVRKKGKGHPTTCLCRHRRKPEVQFQPIRSHSARRGWVVSATPRPLYPRKRLRTQCTGSWLGLGAGLDGHWKSRPPLGFQHLPSRYTYYDNPAAYVIK